MPNIERDKEHAFDCYCKKVLRNEARDIQRRAERMRRREVSISELSHAELCLLTAYDDYFACDREIRVDALSADVYICDASIASAVRMLPQPHRDIIMLSYFLRLSDRAIGEMLSLPRSTVQHHRAAAVRRLRDLLARG